MNDRAGSSSKSEVALVLGSGGARGLAHIGVIRTLEQHGYRIKAIAGSSMGALVGGIYAMGKLDEYEEWVCSLSQTDILKLLDWNFSGGGMMRGNALMQRLKALVGDCDIETLDIQFTAVAVDMDKGKEVWLDSGKLFDAIRASIAIPGVFTPHQYHGLSLLDGGLLNPVPLAPTFRTVADYLVAVDANGEPDASLDRENSSPHAGEAGKEVAAGRSLLQKIRKYLRLFPDSGGNGKNASTVQTMMRALEIMQGALTRQQLSMYEPDILVSIPRNICMFHEFHRAQEIIALGSTIAERELGSFLKK